ncbi:MAG: hypothetical protein OSB21_04535, partial [Myxococcota bacterium]|nr:hypothetical protein [Myxococcota bacterium]
MKNMLSIIVSFAVLSLFACSQQQLPDFPTLNNAPVATELRLVSAPERLVAGAWGRVVAEVRDQFDQPMPGQTVSVAVQISDEVIGLVPALGNTCTTGLAGEPCPVILRSEGQMGQYHLLLSSGALPVVALDIAVDPAPETAHLYINMPGRPVFEFINGRQDGLVFQQPLALPLGQQGLQVKLVLLDQFGNPIAAMIAAELLRAAPAALPDAGPAADAGRDAAVNDAALSDAAVNDAAPNDAAPSDAAANDAAPNDAAANDAAPSDAAVNDAAPNDADRVALSLAGCGGQLSDRAEAMPNSDGELVLCLRGLELGAARIALSVPGILRVENEQGSQSEQIILRSQTVSVGGHRLQIPGQPALTCDVGGALEQALTLRVIDRADPPNPVPGVEVETGHQGMESVAPRIAISGADGSLRINGQCPALRRVETQIMAWIKDDPNERIMQPVEVQVGAVAQMRASLENSAPFDPWAMRIGEPRNLHIELFDEAANSVPQGEVSFSLLQAFRGLVRLDADACGATAETSLHGLTCQADGAGRLVIALRAAGTLPGVPVPLLLRGHHQGGLDPQLNLPLSLETGAPVSLSVSPAGQLIALVGSGDGDSIRARIADAGGNPVAGVAVSLRELLRQNGEVERHPDPAVSLDLPGDGLSDGRGEVIWHIAQISRPSALQSAGHELEFSSILSNGPAQQTLWVSTSVGSATALVLRDNSDVVVPAVDGAWQLHGDAGSALAQRYTLSLVNARGALVQQALGLALTLRSEPAAGCDALAGLAAARFVQGQIQFGGQQIPFSFGTAARSCRYLLEVDSVEQELLLLQRTGQPSGGIFESNIGSVEAPIWRQIPDDGRLQPRPGFSLHPQAQPFDQRHDIRLRNPSDAFGNSLLGAAPGQPGRVLQPAPLNAWIWPQVPVLRALPGGATVLQFSVMAGGTFNSDALLIASSLHGWDSPPQLRFTSQQSEPVIGEIRLRGIDRKVFPYSGAGVTHGRVRTNGLNSVAIDRFAGSDQLYQPNPDNCSGCAAENPNDGLERFLSAENRHQAQLLELRFWYVDEAVFEQVDQHGRCIGEACSRAVLHWTRDPRGPLQPPQRIGHYPLIRGTATFDGLVRTYFQTLIPIADMSGGGAFSVAIESDAGEGRLLTSAGKPIFAPLRPLFRPRPLEILAPPPPDGLLARYAAAGRLQENFRGFARILDVHRIQADNDADEELLICGD